MSASDISQVENTESGAMKSVINPTLRFTVDMYSTEPNIYHKRTCRPWIYH